MSTLDAWLDAPGPVTVVEVDPKPVPRPKGFQGTYTPAHGWKIIRPSEAELMTIMELDHDEFADKYRELSKKLNKGVKYNPDSRAWALWHHHHDRLVLRRGLR